MSRRGLLGARRGLLGPRRGRFAVLAAFAALALLTVPAGAAAQPAPPTPVPTVTSPPTPGALYTDGQSDRWLLGGTWLYRSDPGDAGVADGFWRGVASTAGWTPVTVPNAYNAGDLSGASMAGGVGWYRRDFTLPASAFARFVPAADRRWIVRFESVNYTATVWLNGHRLGTHQGAYLPFEYLLSHVRPGVNHLIVRVDDRRTGADFPPGPGGGWWNYGGILREVYLRAVQRADIAEAVIRPVLPCPRCAATIDEQARVANPTGRAETVTLTGVYGGRRLSFGSDTIPAGGAWLATAAVKLPHPHLWAPGSPYLYRATLRLTDAAHHLLQTYTDLSGVRSITVVGGRLELNGRALDLRGVNIHQQTLITGAALTPAQEAQEIGWAQELGAGIIRAHYPLAPEQLEQADRDGILVWSEIPVYQVANTYLGQPGWRRRALALLADNIAANQNHPSVLVWSIGNELPTPVTGAEAGYIRAAAAEVSKLDPTRPAAMAISSWPGVKCQSAYAPLGVIGDNEYFGWFDAGGGTDDDRDALGPYLDFLRACYPKQGIMISEFGFEGSRAGPVDERGTYAFQINSMEYHLGVFAQKPWLSGAMWFAMQDFAARPGYSGGDPVPHPPFVEKGVVDLNGNLKPGFAPMSQIFHATQQIAPAPGAGS